MSFANKQVAEIYQLVFGLPYAGPCVPLFVSGGVSVAGYNQFSLGYWLFGLAGIWMLGHWSISDPITSRRSVLRHIVNKESTRYQKARKEYWMWFCIGCVVLLFLTSLLLWWTHERKLGFERDQVAAHLGIKYDGSDGNDSLRANFTLTNGSDFAVSKRHIFWCGINMLVGSERIWIHGPIVAQTSTGGWIISDVPHLSMLTTFPIGPHQDAQTDSCLSAFKFADVNAKLLCVDMLVSLSYYLADQPELQKHGQRFVYRRDDAGNGSWHEQSRNSEEDFCYSYLDPDQKLERDKEVEDAMRRLFQHK